MKCQIMMVYLALKKRKEIEGKLFQTIPIIGKNEGTPEK